MVIIIVFSPIIITLRIFKKKESPKRFLEKFSFFKEKRRNGKLIWFHCSSVGEFLSIIPLVEKLEIEEDIKNILITTSTLSSSKIFSRFKFKKTFHQFYPIDNSLIINRFLNYWRPSAVFFVESEIWPEMLNILKKKKIKIFLLNARISKKSFNRWKHLKDMGINIFQIFDFIFPQNKETLNYLKYFRIKKMQILGNLKFAETEKLDNYKFYKKKFYNRKILCAASTHNNEEEIVSNIHLNLKKKVKNLLTIIIPRHTERTKEIIETLDHKKLNYICHSERKKINKNTDIYLVDTYGESKSFYSVSKVVFLGGSLIKRGGQNPLEAIRYGCYITHGKHIFNFTEIYNMLNKKKLSFEAKNFKQLNKIIFNLLKKKSNNKKEINNFKKIGIDILRKNFMKIRVLI
ncbi:MAG: 3-deoxy-D-manno-octulosonic acid transferase [Candidatus Pelagibacter sp.]